MDVDKKSLLEAMMKTINKEQKENVIHFGVSTYDYERIPFTSPRLNDITYGGIPVGKLVEFYGEEHGGKTTTALDVVANYQQLYDRAVLYVDAENALDTVWATKLGIDLDNMVIYNPTTQGAEDILENVLKLISSGTIGLVVIDSLGVLTSNQAMEKSIDQKTYGGISMALTNFGKKAIGLCKKTDCTIIGINQNRADMNSPYGGTVTTGGHGWKYDVVMRLEFRRGKFIDEKGNELSRSAENPAGNIVNVVMTKSKVCPASKRIGYYTIRYASGIDYLGDLIEVAIKYGIIERAGAWFSIVDTETGEVLNDEKIQGQSNVYAFLENHTDILKRVEELVEQALKSDESF